MRLIIYQVMMLIMSLIITLNAKHLIINSMISSKLVSISLSNDIDNEISKGNCNDVDIDIMIS